MKSTAKAITLSRNLKEKLQFRGFTCVESFDSEGWPKLTLNTDEASISIVGQDAISKDIFGNNLVSFCPHTCTFSSRDDAMSTAVVAKIMHEIAKTGIEKTAIKVDAASLATAEASAPVEVITADLQWPTKGV